jgi:hypothetical protein
MDTGVATIQDDNYAKASSEWLQVSRQWSGNIILFIGYLYMYVHTYMFVYVCIGHLYGLKLIYVGIVAFISYSVNFQNDNLYSIILTALP